MSEHDDRCERFSVPGIYYGCRAACRCAERAAQVAPITPAPDPAMLGYGLGFIEGSIAGFAAAKETAIAACDRDIQRSNTAREKAVATNNWAEANVHDTARLAVLAVYDAIAAMEPEAKP